MSEVVVILKCVTTVFASVFIPSYMGDALCAIFLFMSVDEFCFCFWSEIVWITPGGRHKRCYLTSVRCWFGWWHGNVSSCLNCIPFCFSFPLHSLLWLRVQRASLLGTIYFDSSTRIVRCWQCTVTGCWICTRMLVWLVLVAAGSWHKAIFAILWFCSRILSTILGSGGFFTLFKTWAP